MAAEAHAPTAGEYIVHHLTHLGNAKPKSLVDFSVINFDSVFYAALLGMISCWLLWLAARKATSRSPRRTNSKRVFMAARARRRTVMPEP